jgi:hypothetical protein
MEHHCENKLMKWSEVFLKKETEMEKTSENKEVFDKEQNIRLEKYDEYVKKIQKDNIERENITEKYFRYHDHFCKIHGNKTIIFVEIGFFHEAYCTDTFGPNLLYLSKLIEVIRVKRKKNNIINIKNPYMIGFPVHESKKYFNILIENYYTIVVINDKEKTIIVTENHKKTLFENIIKFIKSINMIFSLILMMFFMIILHFI